MISIVIPIYNERECLPALVQRLTAAAPAWQDDYEVIVVDDGSTDGSADLMREVVAGDAHFCLVQLSRNFGHQGAISAGLEQARGDVVVIMDGDLQDPPEELPRFLEQWRAGYEVVYALRTQRKEGLLKRSAYLLFYRFLSLISDINIPLDAGDFCLLDRRVVDVLRQDMPENIRFIRGMRAYAGFRQIGVRYERESRHAGRSKYSFRKLLRLATDGVLGFSTLPLRLSVYLGLLISGLSFAVGIFFIVHRILNFKILGYSPEDTPGLASLAVGIYFLGGIGLVFLGIIGEYVGRIYVEVKKRPPYIVDRVVGGVTEEERPSSKAAGR